MLRSSPWRLFLCLMAGAWIVAAGCRRNAPTPVAVQPVAATPAVVTEPETAQPDLPAAADEVEPKPAEETPAATPIPQVSKERILLLAPGNPLIVEFQLTIDGQPHADALPRLVDEVLKLADADGDGRTLWKELCDCKRIKYGQYGNLPINGENGEKQIIERYDIARDGVVDRSELPRFLTRNAGGSRPFSVRGTLDHRDLNRRGAPTWRAIDTDEDGVISADERSRAAALLAGRDNDDDEILLASELNPRFQSPDPEMMGQSRRRGPDAIRLLGPHADWSTVQRSLEHDYGGSRTLRADSFALTPELFTQLDANADGRILRGEFPRLNEVPAQVVVEVEFGGSQESGARSQESEGKEGEGEVAVQRPRIRLVHFAEGLVASGQAVVEQPGRLTISLGGTTLTFYTNDTVASGNFAARVKQSLAMFDQNKDGYLEAGELPESLQDQFGRFEAIDADEDGKAYPHEIEAYLSQQQAGLRAQIHARATDTDDVLFAALDTDHDERLDSREIESAAARLAALDKNGDGGLTVGELPEVLLIGLARGSIETPDATFAPPPILARGPDRKAPRWFTSMDANQDGVISRREFLGAAEKFSELDKNTNGLLEIDEAPSGST